MRLFRLSQSRHYFYFISPSLLVCGIYFFHSFKILSPLSSQNSSDSYNLLNSRHLYPEVQNKTQPEIQKSLPEERSREEKFGGGTPVNSSFSDEGSLYAGRAGEVEEVCQKHKLGIPLKLYNQRLRYDRKHKFIYCENFKVGSTTWAAHLLKLKGKRSGRSDDHARAKELYPRLIGTQRYKFKRRKGMVSFMVVREPFQRLVSAYNDKMGVEYGSGNPAYNAIHRHIKNKYRTEEREGVVPTFEEFVKFVIGELSPKLREMKRKLERKTTNRHLHWLPIYINCAPCSEKYDVIAKMETFTEDTLYLKKQLGLRQIKVSLVGNTSQNRTLVEDKTVQVFKNINPALIKPLYNIYKFDFEMFGYSPAKYLQLASQHD